MAIFLVLFFEHHSKAFSIAKASAVYMEERSARTAEDSLTHDVTPECLDESSNCTALMHAFSEHIVISDDILPSNSVNDNTILEAKQYRDCVVLEGQTNPSYTMLVNLLIFKVILRLTKICLVTYIYNKHSPLRIVRVNKPHAPWLNDDLRKTLKEKDRLFSLHKANKTEQNLTKFKKARNAALLKIRNEKKAYLEQLSREKSDSKELWTGFRHFNVNSRTKPVIPDFVNDSNQVQSPSLELDDFMIGGGGGVSSACAILSDTFTNSTLNIFRCHPSPQHGQHLRITVSVVSVKDKAMSSPKFCFTQIANSWISISINREPTDYASRAILLTPSKRFLKFSYKLETISTADMQSQDCNGF
nr:unnamed protein product [Callosobruchus chinensis]